MYPTLETIRQFAQRKEYRRIPLCRELYADRYTPVEVMRTLRKASRHCYLLESASQMNNPVPVSLLSGDRKPQIRFLGNHHSGSGNLYYKSFRM